MRSSLVSRRFSGEEVCQNFHGTSAIAGDLTHGTFANTQHMVRWFCMATFTPWIKKVESLNFRGASSPIVLLRLELDLSGLMRGDPDRAMAAHEIAFENGIFTIERGQEVEGYNPRGEVAPTVS